MESSFQQPVAAGPTGGFQLFAQTCISGLRAAIAFSVALAALPATGAGEHHRYTIATGDTLIAIARRMLEDPGDWPRLQKLNRIVDPYRLRPGTVIAIPIDWLRRETAPGRVVSATGDVTSGSRALAAGDLVQPGEQLITREQSFVTIELVDGSRLTLQPSSRLKIERMVRVPDTTRAETRLRLDTGRVESSVHPNGRTKPHYSVDTPGATIGVRGTDFRVATDGGTISRTEVNNGNVGVARQKAGKTPAINVPAGFGFVSTADRNGAPVALLQPPDLSSLPALQERPLVRFALQPLAGARSYRAQILDQQGRLLSEDIAAKPEVRFADLADGNYVLKVRGIDVNGLEGLNAERVFRLKARPEPPFPIDPIAGRKMRGEAATLSWSLADGAARYRIQLATDTTFASPMADIEGIDASHIVPLPRLAPGDYVWRARSIRADGDAGPWGDPQSFSLRALPGNPESPSIDKESISFTWPAEPGQTFLFHLARDEGFADIVVEQHLDQPRTTLPRPEAGTYHLRVRATDADGFVGPFTATQTIIVPAPTPWWMTLMLLTIL